MIKARGTKKITNYKYINGYVKESVKRDERSYMSWPIVNKINFSIVLQNFRIKKKNNKKFPYKTFHIFNSYRVERHATYKESLMNRCEFSI